MIRMIGSAQDFWRLRITRLDTTEDFDFEWHDDILYREPHPSYGHEVESWYVEAVRIDDPDAISRLAACHSQGEARDLLAAIASDLSQMTKSEFEAAYVDTGDHGDVGVE